MKRKQPKMPDAQTSLTLALVHIVLAAKAAREAKNGVMEEKIAALRMAINAALGETAAKPRKHRVLN